MRCPAGRAHCAWSGHFVTGVGLRAGAPDGRGRDFTPTNGRIAARLNARHEVSLADDVEGAAPAGLVEDVEQDMAHEGDAVGDGGLVDLVGGGLEGPVDEHGAADDGFARNEAPEAAVEGL